MAAEEEPHRECVASAGLAAGEEVRFRGQVRLVTGLAAGTALCPAREWTWPCRWLNCSLTRDSPGDRWSAAPLPPEGLLDGLPAAVTERARWLEAHLAEVVNGLPADAGLVPSRARVRPGGHLAGQREIAKAAELRLGGHDVPLRTLQRLRRSYETEGVWGLVDHRFTRQSSVACRVDERVVEPSAGRSRRKLTADGHRGPAAPRTAQILAADHGMADPSQVMLYGRRSTR